MMTSGVVDAAVPADCARAMQAEPIGAAGDAERQLHQPSEIGGRVELGRGHMRFFLGACWWEGAGSLFLWFLELLARGTGEGGGGAGRGEGRKEVGSGARAPT